MAAVFSFQVMFDLPDFVRILDVVTSFMEDEHIYIKASRDRVELAGISAGRTRAYYADLTPLVEEYRCEEEGWIEVYCPDLRRYMRHLKAAVKEGALVKVEVDAREDKLVLSIGGGRYTIYVPPVTEVQYCEQVLSGVKSWIEALGRMEYDCAVRLDTKEWHKLLDILYEYKVDVGFEFTSEGVSYWGEDMPPRLIEPYEMYAYEAKETVRTGIEKEILEDLRRALKKALETITLYIAKKGVFIWHVAVGTGLFLFTVGMLPDAVPEPKKVEIKGEKIAVISLMKGDIEALLMFLKKCKMCFNVLLTNRYLLFYEEVYYAGMPSVRMLWFYVEPNVPEDTCLYFEITPETTHKEISTLLKKEGMIEVWYRDTDLWITCGGVEVFRGSTTKEAMDIPSLLYLKADVEIAVYKYMQLKDILKSLKDIGATHVWIGFEYPDLVIRSPAEKYEFRVETISTGDWRDIYTSADVLGELLLGAGISDVARKAKLEYILIMEKFEKDKIYLFSRLATENVGLSVVIPLSTSEVEEMKSAYVGVTVDELADDAMGALHDIIAGERARRADWKFIYEHHKLLREGIRETLASLFMKAYEEKPHLLADLFREHPYAEKLFEALTGAEWLPVKERVERALEYLRSEEVMDAVEKGYISRPTVATAIRTVETWYEKFKRGETDAERLFRVIDAVVSAVRKDIERAKMMEVPPPPPAKPPEEEFAKWFDGKVRKILEGYVELVRPGLEGRLRASAPRVAEKYLGRFTVEGVIEGMRDEIGRLREDALERYRRTEIKTEEAYRAFLHDYEAILSHALKDVVDRYADKLAEAAEAEQATAVVPPELGEEMRRLREEIRRLREELERERRERRRLEEEVARRRRKAPPKPRPPPKPPVAPPSEEIERVAREFVRELKKLL